jgi:uncharacterized protein YndB with AHSA1/START domain
MLETGLDGLGGSSIAPGRLKMTAPTGLSTITKPSDREIRVERVFAAPRDRVWRAFTEPELLAKWWGRENKLVIERSEVVRGGHWRYVEQLRDGVHGFEGRYREVKAPERIVRTFEYDGMPGHVSVETAIFADAGEGRTKVVTTSLFHTTEERDGMLHSGMEQGLNESYTGLDRLLSDQDRAGS